MYGLAREIFLRLVLHENLIAFRFHLHGLPFAYSLYCIGEFHFLNADRDLQMLQVVVDKVDVIFALGIADGSKYSGKGFVFEGHSLRQNLHSETRI